MVKLWGGEPDISLRLERAHSHRERSIPPNYRFSRLDVKGALATATLGRFDYGLFLPAGPAIASRKLKSPSLVLDNLPLAKRLDQGSSIGMGETTLLLACQVQGFQYAKRDEHNRFH